MKKIAIILSGGVGSRMGLDVPKQYVKVNGRPIIEYCIKVFLENEKTDAIVIVVAEEWQKFVIENISKFNPKKPIFYAMSGETRQYSIYNALKVVKKNKYKNDDIVLIHDAARPLVSDDLINRCYDACNEVDGALPVIRVKDTIYFSEDGMHIKSLLNRDHLWSGQAPEAFRFGKYLKAHDDMSRDELLRINGSTEIAFKNGLDCKMVAGDPMNFKVTTPEDLSNFESIINRK